MGLVQSAHNSVAKGAGRSVSATFSTPTAPGSAIAIVLTAVGGTPVTSVVPAGFVKALSIGTPRVHLTTWYQQNAPKTSKITVTSPADRSLQLQIIEMSGVRQSSALDFAIGKVAPNFHTGDAIDTGLSATTVQADSTILGIVTNDYASTTQSGFFGGFTKLFDTVSPAGNSDADRSRLTIHHIGATATGQFRLLGRLSAARQWIGMLICFRGGSSGPKQLSSRNAPPIITIGGSGARAALTAFGPLRSTTAPPIITMGGAGGSARIDLFDYQYRLNGLLVGAGTNYDVVGHEGLEGWDMRTSDKDQPRSDGAQRGVDLQSARQILFEVELVGDLTNGVEAAVDELYRALRPRRDTDWDLEWRHPGRGVKITRVRPTNNVRQLDHDGTVLTKQKVLLRGADPRHYSIRPRIVTVPVAAAGVTDPPTVTASNAGSADAYPVIRIKGAATSVSRVQLVNATADVVFDVAVPITDGAELIGDMPALVVSAPRSPVTLDGAGKYGAWQFPRDPFYLSPGDNQLYARTTPEGVPVVVTVAYRHTWPG